MSMGEAITLVVVLGAFVGIAWWLGTFDGREP